MDSCNTCETKTFCGEIGRCLSGMITDRFGEADAEDWENDELTADLHKGLKKIAGEHNVLNKPLSKDELEIIKIALN